MRKTAGPGCANWRQTPPLFSKIENSARASRRDTLGSLTEREQALFIEMMQSIVVGNSHRDSAAALFD